MAGLPTWEEVRALMLAPKPPLACTAFGLGRGGQVRVLFDGAETWFLEDDGRVELRASDERSMLDGDDGLRRTDGVHVHSFGWVKSAIEPRRLGSLQDADGAVTGREDAGGRPCLVVEASGLKREGGAPFRLWVDEETGVILRMVRIDDPAPLLVLYGLRVGTIAP